MKYNTTFKPKYQFPKTVVQVFQAKDQPNGIRCCLAEAVFEFDKRDNLESMLKGQTGVAVKNGVSSGNWNFWPDLKHVKKPICVHRSELFFEHDPIGHEK